MRIGVPKEIKPDEFRVGVTPAAAREYVAQNHQVIVETRAGAGIGASDEAYRAHGAAIVSTADEVFATTDMIVKVKEPQPGEWGLLREGQILFAYLHLAPDPEQAKGLLASGCTAIAYETVTDRAGGLPLLAPMSEVAGRLAIEAAAYCLHKPNCGVGKLIGGVPGVPPSTVAILGGGVVGTHAARMAIGLGARVTIFDRSLPRLRQLDEMFSGRVTTCFATMSSIEQEALTADVVIGAVLVPGANAPKLISKANLKQMTRGAVLIDVAIDQGGCFETSRPTTHSKPTYVIDDVIHYCVANMPGAVPITSSVALNNATLPFGMALATKGLMALVEDGNLREGLNIHHGKVTHAAVARSLNVDFTNATSLLAGTRSLI
jgi:alanine dehydrogenase